MAQRPATTEPAVRCEVTYSEPREMWRVAVYIEDRWRKDEWFNGESSAWYYARWRETVGDLDGRRL